MRNFIITSKSASTSSKINDIKKSGRWDILFHSIISALFSSNNFRDDVNLYLYLLAKPNPNVCIKIKYEKDNTISKKDLKKLIEMCLKKINSKKNQNKENKILVHSGVSIQKISFENLIKKINSKNIFYLENKENHIKNLDKKNQENPVFILGDYDGFDKKVLKFMKKNFRSLSLGNKIYFTSQAITIINYEFDN